MSWNHRLYRDAEGTLHFREVHYDDNGAPMGATEIFTCGNDVAEMIVLADRLKAACALPVLSLADFAAPNGLARIGLPDADESPEARRAAVIADLISINPYPKD